MIIGWCGLDGETETGKTVLFYMIYGGCEKSKDDKEDIKLE